MGRQLRGILLEQQRHGSVIDMRVSLGEKNCFGLKGGGERIDA